MVFSCRILVYRRKREAFPYFLLRPAANSANKWTLWSALLSCVRSGLLLNQAQAMRTKDLRSAPCSGGGLCTQICIDFLVQRIPPAQQLALTARFSTSPHFLVLSATQKPSPAAPVGGPTASWVRCLVSQVLHAEAGCSEISGHPADSIQINHQCLGKKISHQIGGNSALFSPRLASCQQSRAEQSQRCLPLIAGTCSRSRAIN